MKENHEIDKLLRDTLDESTIQPSEGSKQLFLDKAASMMPVSKQTQNSRFIWGSGMVILLLTGLLLLWLNIYEEKTAGSGTPVAPLINNEFSLEKTISENVAPETKPDANEAMPSATMTNNSPIITLDEKVRENINRQLQPPIGDMQTDIAQAATTDNISDIVTENEPAESKSASEKEVAEASDVEVLPDIATPQVEAINNQPAKMKAIQHSSLGIGLFYRPEMIFNIIENEKLIHNSGFEIQYRFFGNRYSARTGAGLSISKGYYEYAAEYKPYLGTYSALDSITFTLAANNFHLIPTYYKSEKDVHDTASETYHAKVHKQHMYIQIPLEFGYDFIMQPKYRLGLRFGPTLSVLANRKPVSFIYDPGKDQLVQINRITPERILTNWHFSGGINFSYLINGFVVEIEPRAAYYFNSVYEKSNSSSPPYSFSLRIAFGIF